MKVAIKENEVFPSSRWEEWNEELLTNEVYQFQIIEVVDEYANDCKFSDFDLTETGYELNIEKYLKRKNEAYELRNKPSFEEMQTDFNIDVDFRLSMLELGI